MLRHNVFRLSLCCLALVALIFITSKNSVASEGLILPVLVYHHIQEKLQSDVACTPEQFEMQILALKNAGFTPLTIAQTKLFIAGALDSKIAKPVMITFDDGYESLYQYALPVARRHRFCMSAFVVTSRIGRKLQFASYLTENQIREMASSGVFEFGSHSHDLHTEITRIYDAFGGSYENPVANLLNRDLRISSAHLESITGKRPDALAWPYGKFNSDLTGIARRNGFKIHFTSEFGYNEAGSNPFMIKRIPITSRDTSESVIKKATASQ